MSTPRSSLYGGDISSIVIDNKTNSIILETESDLGSVLHGSVALEFFRYTSEQENLRYNFLS